MIKSSTVFASATALSRTGRFYFFRYSRFTACSGIEGVSKEQAKEAAKSNQSWLQKLMSNLGEIFAPLIPALICGGLILGIRNIIGDINFFANGTKRLADISQFCAGTYQFLWLIG